MTKALTVLLLISKKMNNFLRLILCSFPFFKNFDCYIFPHISPSKFQSIKRKIIPNFYWKIKYWSLEILSYKDLFLRLFLFLFSCICVWNFIFLQILASLFFPYYVYFRFSNIVEVFGFTLVYFRKIRISLHYWKNDYMRLVSVVQNVFIFQDRKRYAIYCFPFNT